MLENEILDDEEISISHWARRSSRMLKINLIIIAAMFVGLAFTLLLGMNSEFFIVLLMGILLIGVFATLGLAYGIRSIRKSENHRRISGIMTGNVICLILFALACITIALMFVI